MNKIQESEKYRLMVENSIVGAYIIEDGKFVYVNRRLEQLSGYTNSELLNMNPLTFVHEDDRAFVAENLQKKILGEECERDFCVKVVDTDGNVKYVHVDGIQVELDGRKVIAGTFIDITEKTIAVKKIEKLVNYDSLTGLYNRHYFNIHSEYLLKKAQRDQSRLAVLLFDIDNFKRINDSLGHKAGDIVLVQTGKLISDVLRDSDYFFRLGGDEFTVIINDFKSESEIKILTKRIQKALRSSIEVDELSFHISLSIGISLFPEHGTSMETLQKSADIAMYQSKKDGKNRFSFFAQDSGSSSKILELENDFYEGIERGELELYLQPQVDVATSRLVGAEALVRWNHPEKGVLTPNIFLPLAQDTGLLYKLDLIMIDKAYNLLKEYDTQGKLNFTISVNISNALFHHQRFFSIMQKFQKKYGHLCKYIMLELTEEILMVDNSHANKIMKSLKLIGYKMAIDDFGTGYSSFGNLKMMEINELKIDRSFIKDIGKNENDKAIVKAVIAMGHSLGLSVLAEGVEEKCQVEILKEMDCDTIQGFYFDKPMPAALFSKCWLD